MPITELQKQERKKHIGSSDMAAVLGVNPWRSAYDVWADKTGRLPDMPENEAMAMGTRYEGGVLGFAMKHLGPLLCNIHRSLPEAHLAANIDAIVAATNEPVEAKTTGLHSRVVEIWGDEGTNQVPDHVIIQCHVHMICMNGAPVCHVPVLIGGRGEIMYRVNRRADLCDIIVERSNEFWTKYVETDIPPEDSQPTLQVIKLLKREPKSQKEINADHVRMWVAAKEAESEAVKLSKEVYAIVAADLGDAEAGTCGAFGAVTYLLTTRLDKPPKWLEPYIEQTQELLKRAALQLHSHILMPAPVLIEEINTLLKQSLPTHETKYRTLKYKKRGL